MLDPQVSIVIPVYDEEESLPELCSWIVRVMTAEAFRFEVILVDDGSADRSWQVIAGICAEDTRFKGIRFTRNYGKSAALHTGFQAATGAVVITMDADMQDSPDEIPALYSLVARDGFHLVSGWKKQRKDPWSKTLPSRFFNAVTRWISGIRLHDFNCGLKAYDAQVVKHISVYGEMHRYIPLIAKWAGYSRITEKVVEHRARKYGKTKYGFGRFITGFLDLLSITFVSRFRQKPMHFFGTFGIVSFLIGFVFTVKLFWEKMDSLFFSRTPIKRDITEQPLFFLALVAVVIGVQLFLTGFIAEMLSMQSLTKKDYLVNERVGFDLPDPAKKAVPTREYSGRT